MRLKALSLSLLCSLSATADNLLITGSIASNNSQDIYAPKTNTWRVQVQWLAPEGEIVNKGDLVAVFDGASMQSQLEQNRIQLESAQQQLARKESDLKQKVDQAAGQLEVAQLRVDKARIEANIPKGEVSDYDLGQYQLAYERALLNKIKAQETLKLREEEFNTGVEKQKIEIVKLEENIEYQEKQLKKLNVKAQITGPMTHAMHPWTGVKISAGTTLQSNMRVGGLQAQGNYLVEAWVHEIDVDKINLNSSISMSLDAYPDSIHVGKISHIASQAEARPQWGESVYYRVQIQFEKQPEQSLTPGMSVRVVVEDNNNA